MDFELSSEFSRIQAIPHFTIFAKKSGLTRDWIPRCPTKFKQEASQRIVAGPNGGFCIAFCPRLSGWRAFFKRGPTVSKRKVRYRLDRLSIQILPAVGPVPRPAAPLAPQCPPRRAMLTGSVSLTPRSRRRRWPRRRLPDSSSRTPSASSPPTAPPAPILHVRLGLGRR